MSRSVAVVLPAYLWAYIEQALWNDEQQLLARRIDADPERRQVLNHRLEIVQKARRALNAAMEEHLTGVER